MGFSPIRMKALPLALQQFSRTPSAAAAIASFSAHALLFVLLPLLPDSALKTGEPEIKRSVDVVELTPTEQSRLPEISDATLELPPIAQQPFPVQPPSANTLPPAGFSLNPLPDSPPAPSGFSAFPDFPSYSSSAPIILFPDSPPRPPRTQPAPNPPQAAPPKPPEAPTRPSNPQSAPAGSSASNNPDSTRQNPPNTQNPRQPDQSEPQQATLPQTRPRSLDDEIRDRREQIAEQIALLAPDDVGTGEGVAQGRYVDWFQKATDWLGEDYDGKNAEEIEIEASYPEAACLRRLSGGAIVGVVVDAEGKVVRDPVAPQILQGSGITVFNQQALEAAALHPFAATGAKKAYQVLIKFEYSKEKCPAGAIPPPAQGQG